MDDGKRAEEIEPDLVAKVAEELMASSDASGAQLLGDGGLLTQVTRAVLGRALGGGGGRASGIREG